MSFNTIKDVKEFLAQIPKFADSTSNAIGYTLNTIKEFCYDLGNPQEQFRSIHVAGTNGKGSTCRLLSSMFQSAGFCVGLYTSPHLVSYNDRFCINSKPAKDDELLAFFKQHGKRVIEAELTYFEISTAFAFWYFHKKNVDVAVIETGLGGRLDATNIIQPELSVITSIGRDHEDILGNNLQKIAREKAGIIKKGLPVVVGNLPSKAEKVIRNRAQELDSEFYEFWSYEIDNNNNQLLLKRNGVKTYLPFPFIAPVQALNIAIAYRAIDVLRKVSNLKISTHAVEEALALFNDRFPHTGCFQKLVPQLNWYYDGAHNMDALQQTLKSTSHIGQRDNINLVLALMGDKINKRFLNQFSGFKKIYYYEVLSRRSAPYQQVLDVLPQAVELPSRNKQLEKKLIRHLKSQLVLFAGSFYFYNTVRRWVKEVTS